MRSNREGRYLQINYFLPSLWWPRSIKLQTSNFRLIRA